MTNLVLALLETERPLSLREIGAAVAGYPPNHGALRQAFERDKASLRDAGIPVRTVRIDGEDQAGYLIPPEDYYLPDLGLDVEEVEALAFALAAVRLEGGATGDIAAKIGSPGVTPFPPIAVLPSLPVLATLEEALRDRATVRFRYHDRARVVSGYRLIFKLGSWYFIGSDASIDAGGAIRTFRCDRIQDTPVLGSKGEYEVPTEFNVADELRSSPFVRDSSFEATEVAVKVWPRSAPAVIAVVGHAAVEHRGRDGSVELRFSVADEQAIISFLLGFGEDVEVLSPPAVRASVIEQLGVLAAPTGASR